jgi:hypothetical protein
MVLSVYQEWPEMKGHVMQLFARLEAVESRLEARSDPRMTAPPRSQFNPTETGSNVIIEHNGQRHVAPSWTIEAIRVKLTEKEQAENWQGLMGWGKWTAKNIIMLVIAAIVIGLLSVHLGLQLHSP